MDVDGLREETVVADWMRRVAALEAGLGGAGRRDLVSVATSPMRQLVGELERASASARQRALMLLGECLSEIRECLHDPSRQADVTLFREVDLLALELSARDGAVARTMLDSLLDSGEDDLDAVLDGIAATDAGEAPPRDELGTLGEPLPSADPSSSGSRVLMKGELQPGLLSDLIQLFCTNKETGRLVLEGADGAVASLYFKSGAIVDAVSAGEVGERGFFAGMMIRQGRFSYQRGVETHEVRIFRSAQHLIMDTLRLIDEAS